MAGVGITWPSKLYSHKPLSSKSKLISRSNSPLVVKMTVSVDEKKKTFTLQKSEEAFTKAKVTHFFSFSNLLVFFVEIPEFGFLCFILGVFLWNLLFGLLVLLIIGVCCDEILIKLVTFCDAFNSSSIIEMGIIRGEIS